MRVGGYLEVKGEVMKLDELGTVVGSKFFVCTVNAGGGL